MSLVNYEKEKFALLQSKFTKVLNLLEKDFLDINDELAIDLLKKINTSFETVFIELDDLRNYLKTKTNKDNKYYKQKVEEYKERQLKIKELIPYLLTSYLKY
jgi:hypothetical protein